MAGVLALVAAGALACSDETAGTPSAASTSQSQTPPSSATVPPFPVTTTPSTEPSGGQGGSLAGSDPCTLSAQAAAQVDAGTGTPSTLGDARVCGYQANGVTLKVGIFDALGLDDIVSAEQPTKTQVGSHQARKWLSPPSLCVISLGVGDASRVDVMAGARGDQTKACQVATQAATALEPSLPK
ncbi:uncharacterized protein DUF3558 [Labedaea rhizosphaerae]|uniref:Uncharacterized protein DUF3558 n=2 Tax=Labedaea rhizosphaerae TaxID=598644 RepID=A0A4R6SQ99_LABRH|nr:uncharacterized protein DUF3558 [Labedaea rhizosphaerae]